MTKPVGNRGSPSLLTRIAKRVRNVGVFAAASAASFWAAVAVSRRTSPLRSLLSLGPIEPVHAPGYSEQVQQMMTLLYVTVQLTDHYLSALFALAGIVIPLLLGVVIAFASVLELSLLIDAINDE